MCLCERRPALFSCIHFLIGFIFRQAIEAAGLEIHLRTDGYVYVSFLGTTRIKGYNPKVKWDCNDPKIPHFTVRVRQGARCSARK